MTDSLASCIVPGIYCAHNAHLINVCCCYCHHHHHCHSPQIWKTLKISVTSEILFYGYILFPPLSNTGRDTTAEDGVILRFHLIYFFLELLGKVKREFELLFCAENFQNDRSKTVCKAGVGSQGTRNCGLTAWSGSKRMRIIMYCLREQVFLLSEKWNLLFLKFIWKHNKWVMYFNSDTVWESFILL